IRDFHVTGVQTCALPILLALAERAAPAAEVPAAEAPAAPGPAAPPQAASAQGVSVAPATFEQLAPMPADPEPANIGLIMDVPLHVTVELGRRRMLVREVLELGKGSLIELDKLAGEPVDGLVN